MCAFFVGKPAPSSPLRGLVERIYTKDCKDRRLQGLRLCSSWAYRAANAISIGPACCKVTKALRRKFRFPSTRARSNQGWASANCPRSTSTIARLNMPRKSPASAERRYQRTGLAAVAIPCSVTAIQVHRLGMAQVRRLFITAQRQSLVHSDASPGSQQVGIVVQPQSRPASAAWR